MVPAGPEVVPAAVRGPDPSFMPSAPASGVSWLEVALLAVVAVVFAALLAPLAADRTERPDVTRARQEVERLRRACARALGDTGSLDPACCDAQALGRGQSEPPAACGVSRGCDAPDGVPGEPCWGGPYLAPSPVQDPWGGRYEVRVDEAGVVSAASAGPDRRPGTGDDLRASP